MLVQSLRETDKSYVALSASRLGTLSIHLEESWVAGTIIAIVCTSAKSFEVRC